jgi:uncharacterized RDD family membrane protein YckC
MQKQIIYSKFIHRLFAMTIDMVVIMIILFPVVSFLSRSMFLYVFHDFFVLHNVDMSDANAVNLATQTAEFASYITASRFMAFSGSVFIAQVILIGVYLVTLWHKFGTTPGKLAMRLKIVDANDYSKRPPLYNLIKRFCAYSISFLGIWWIIFNKKGLALHDKIADTVVIKM